MTQSETRVLARTAAVLLLVSAGRFAWDTRRPPPVLPEAGDDLSELITASRRLEEEGERRGRPLAAGERLDPNRAGEEELDRLPGLGPATARAIVAARERDGPFAAPEDLLRVRGIGSATLERMRPHLEIGPVRVGAARASGRTGAPGVLVDLNRAGAAELERLPGVGPALARRIVAARDARGAGGFGSVDDLLEVAGIGPATLERLRPSVTAGGR